MMKQELIFRQKEIGICKLCGGAIVGTTYKQDDEDICEECNMEWYYDEPISRMDMLETGEYEDDWYEEED